MNTRLFFLCSVVSFAMLFGRDLSQYQVDFHESMQNDRVYENVHNPYEHDRFFARTDRKWKIAEQLYNEYILQDFEYSVVPLIPQIIHHIWIGSMLPDYAKEFRKTWIKYNPDWTFVLWTDHPAHEFGTIVLTSFDELQVYLALPDHEQFIIMDMRHVELRNQEAFSLRARNYGEKSDIARYEILNEVGGLYVDTDFECLRSFSDFHHCCSFYTGISHTKEFVLFNGLIGSAPDNPILQEAIDGLRTRVNRGDSLQYSGPNYFTQCFIRKAQACKGRVIAFPVTFLYPWPHYNRSQTYEQARSWIVPETYALHYWKVSWQQ